MWDFDGTAQHTFLQNDYIQKGWVFLLSHGNILGKSNYITNTSKYVFLNFLALNNFFLIPDYYPVPIKNIEKDKSYLIPKILFQSPGQIHGSFPSFSLKFKLSTLNTDKF